MRNFVLRTISSIFLVSFAFAVVYVFPSWMFCLFAAIFVAFGQLEFFEMVEKKNVFVYKYFGTVAGALIPVVIYVGNSFPRMTNLEPILIVGASLFTLTLQFLRRDNAKDHLVSTALTMFSLMYIGWFFSFLVKIRLLDNGANLALFLILVTKSADMGAYAVGSLMGRHELIPRISPNKTKEGTLGGVLISVLTAMVLGKILTHYPAAHLVVLGGAVAVLGQIGDLAESLIKRDCGVKDSGVYFAGIGGMLDLVDSLLFTAPFFYFYVRSL